MVLIPPLSAEQFVLSFLFLAIRTKRKAPAGSQKSNKLGATCFVWDANGKNLNPDLGSKNKWPDFPRLRIAKQPRLPRKGAQVRVLGASATQPGLSPLRRSHCSQALMRVPGSRPGDVISKAGVCSQAGLPPSPCVSHQSFPQHGIRVILMLFNVTPAIRAARGSMTVTLSPPEAEKNPKWSSCLERPLHKPASRFQDVAL